MKEFTEATFAKLTTGRKIKVSLDLIKKIEDSWDLESSKESLLVKLRNHLKWFKSDEDLSKFKLDPMLKSLEGKPNLRTVLNIAMAFERRLALSLKDESILVRKKDRSEAGATTQPLYLVLDNLRSAHNVGSIFRTAECLGVRHIFLVGYTATPEDKSVKKTAMGSDEFVQWSHAEKLDDLIISLKRKNIKLAALETAQGALPLDNSNTKPELALFLGNERFGLEPKTLKQMDFILEIPMRGRKNSLNVSNACAISVFEIITSWGLE